MDSTNSLAEAAASASGPIQPDSSSNTFAAFR